MLFLLLLYYSLDHNNHNPDTKYIFDHLEQFNNTDVTIVGEVKNIDRNNNILLIQPSQPLNTIISVNTTENLDTTKQGDIVEVYGVLTNETHMTAEKIIIYQGWKYNLIFIRSLPAIPFALYLFFRTWRFNLKTYRFERRQKNA